MAKREFVGGPIDATDGRGESHLSEVNGKTVGGTTEDDYHDTDTEAWPSVLNKEDFSPLQQSIIEMLSVPPEKSDTGISDSLNCSNEAVRQVRHKVAAYVEPDAVSFEIPDDPTRSIKIVESTIENGSLPRENNTTQAGLNSTDKDEAEDTGKNDLPRETIVELHEDGYGDTEIAERLDVKRRRVTGYLGAMKQQRMEQDNENGHRDGSEETESDTKTDAADNSEKDLPDDTSSNDDILVEFSLSDIVEIMEASGVDSETKERILKQTLN